MSQFIKFYFTSSMLNMFRTLIHLYRLNEMRAKNYVSSFFLLKWVGREIERMLACTIFTQADVIFCNLHHPA